MTHHRKIRISSRLSKIKRATLNGHQLLGVVVMVALLVPIILPRPTQADDCILDSTFDQDGKVTTNFTQAGDVAHDIAIQPDGKIIAAGVTGYLKSALARYNTDGRLDRSFGSGGRVMTSNTEVNAVALQADGKIVTVGAIDFDEPPYDVSHFYGFGAVRYNNDGSLDRSFGRGGKVGIDNFFNGDTIRASDRAADVVIQPDGKIVIAGKTNENYDHEDVQFALARLNGDGSLDTSFGGDGTVATLFGDSQSRVYGTSVALQPDGKIVVGGYYRGAGGRNFALARYHRDGRLDKTFDRDGRVVTLLSPITDGGDRETFPVFVAVQPDGKILAAGTMEVPQLLDSYRPNDAFVLARYNANGRLDETFGTEGKVNTDFAPYTDSVNDIALQPDGKIVLAGYAGHDPFRAGGFGLARYNPNGSPDNTFDTDGKLISRFACYGGVAYAVAIQANGKIIAAGTSYGNFLLARYPAEPSTDGTPRLGSLTIDNPITPGVSDYSGITLGSVSLCGVAPPGGLEVMLADTNSAASVPASIIVPAGETTACFKIETEYVNKIKTGVITAQLGGVNRRATLVVRPVGLLYFTIDSYYPIPNTTVGNLQLEGPAPPGGTTVTISSSNPELASPVQQVIRFPAGTSYQTFYIRFANVPDRRIVNFKATTSGNSKTAALTLRPTS